jgi:membrane protein
MLAQLLRWKNELEKPLHFADFVWRRFVDDRCFQSAGALSYGTLLALVPLMAVALSIVSGFPLFDQWMDKVEDFVFQNFVPRSGETVQAYMREFAANASKLTAPGIVALIITAVLLMENIEDTFNRIWRVAGERRRLAKFIVYWTVLSLGPILMGAGLAISSYLYAEAMSNSPDEFSTIGEVLLRATPFVVTWLAFAMAYQIIPYRSVRVRSALIGGFLGAVLFELAKRLFGFYLREFPAYEQVYGALSAVPIFLIWLYVSWAVVLLGASFAASLSSYRYRARDVRLPKGLELIGLMLVVRVLWQAQRSGNGMTTAALQAQLPGLTEDGLMALLEALHARALIRRTDASEWLLARDVDDLSVQDLYACGRYHWPLKLPPALKDSPIAKWHAEHTGLLNQALLTPLKALLTETKNEETN